MLLQWKTIFLLYLKLLLVSCAKNSSLTFVIDDTYSMHNDIAQVKRASAEIMNIVNREIASEIKDIVLVTFNDPDVVVRKKTSDKDTLLQALNKIVVHSTNNYDCPEYALSGIEKALEESRSSSYLFVFTDASAKDHYKVKRVISLCQKKQTQVVFVLTDDCHDAHSVNYKVYHEIAMACSGQVFRVLSDEVKYVLETIKETIKGQKSVLTSRVVSSRGFWKAVAFTVDDQSEYVIVSTSGRNVGLALSERPTKGGLGMPIDKIMWKSSGKVVKFNAPKPGTYYAWVKANTDISIIVYARTDFSFSHGFSSFVPKSLDDTAKQPIKGEGHHLSIAVDDPNHTVDIKYAEILNMQEQIIANLPLAKTTKENFYITEKFVSPSSTFKIQVTGINKNTGNFIKRFARTNVNPQDPPEPDSKSPEVKITEGSKVDVDYDGEVLLTCKVSAYPKPTILWTSDNGAILSKNSDLVEKPYDYISYLKLSNLKKAGRYHCKASNNLASNAANIHVQPRSPLKAIKLTTATSKYGKEKKLKCNVDSKYPLNIKWIVPKTLKPSDYSILDDNKVMMIKAVTMDAQGMYTCEAYLKSDPMFNIIAATKLTIEDLAPPAILDTEGPITVKFGDQVHIPCKIIGGAPPPTIGWQVKYKGASHFRNLPGSGQELTILSATLENAGQYRCTATNDIGHKTKDTELVVQKGPEISFDKGSSITVPYGSTNELKCKVIAYPRPIVVWKNSKGLKVLAQIIANNIYETVSILKLTNVRSAETYLCSADNNMGTAVSSIGVKVSPAIVFPSQTTETTSVKFGKPADIKCDAKSSFPMKIKWFYQKNDNTSDMIEIHTSDKYTISSDKKMLRIKSTDLDLVGTYTCEASLVSDENEKGKHRNKVEINNLKAPEIDADSKTIILMKGQNVNVSTFWRVFGVPKPTVTWQFKSKNSASTYVPLTTQGVQITNIGYSSAGTYKCIATNAVGTQTSTIDIIVHGKPEITNTDSVYYGVKGDKVLKVPCEVTGVPEPAIVWRKGGKVVTSDAKITVNENSLLLKDPTAKDSSNFTCEATNKYGSATKILHVDISDFIEPEKVKSRYIYLKRGDSTEEIICDIPNPGGPASIRWYVNAELSAVKGLRYSLQNANFSNDGNYTCRANTDQGSKSINYVVDVGYSPSFIIPSTSPIYWNGNKKEILDCNVDAKPEGNTVWYFNGNKVHKKVSELFIRDKGWGRYTCNVTNVHGSVQQTFDVTSLGCIINRTVENNVQNTPLLINEQNGIWSDLYSENEFYILQNKQKINLQCATKRNPINTFKIQPKNNKIRAECYKEDQFIVDGKKYKFEDLQCKEYVKPSLKFTKKSCMKNGEVIKIGFALDSGFLSAYDVCYEQTNHKTLYTKVLMSDKNLGNIVDPGFKVDTELSNVGPIVKCQYNKRRLVKPVDVPFGPAQAATLSKYNSVPVFEPCDGSTRMSWSAVEESSSIVLETEVESAVWTGGSQYDAAGVPRYLWKVVMFGDTVETLVFVNARDAHSGDILCSKHENDVFGNQLIDNDDLYIYACNKDDFLKGFDVSIDKLKEI